MELLYLEKPGYLVLLAVLPLLVVLSLRSLSGLGPWRRGLALAARCLVILTMTLALAGAHRLQVTRDLTVVFVVDRSYSVPPPQQQQAFDFVKAAGLALDPQRDRFGIVAFNGVAAVEQLPERALGIDALSVPPAPDQTNLAAALRMASALFTNNAMRRIVVLSDGNENVGQALEEVDQLAAAGVPIDVVPLRYELRDEVVFDRLTAPATASLEETINLQMVLRAQRPTSGRIMLYHGDDLVDLNGPAPGAGYPVTLEPGPNRLQVPIPLRSANVHRFRAVFEPDDASHDTIPGNNEGRAFTVVSGPGRILILTSESDLPSANALAVALRQQMFTCDVEPAGAKSIDQVDLLPYSLVILSNVARNYLTAEQEKTLAVYVRELGGGLVMIGGDESYGAGGWMGSPLEDVMPVSFDIKSKRQIPKGALVLVMHACEIPQGNYWGERVAIEAVKALSARDLVGILQYAWQSSEDQYWLVKLREVGEKSNIIRIIRDMNMGDLPDFEALMRPGAEALAARRDAAAKHMIVISDFDPAPPTPETIKFMQDNRISCSTVAIGFGGHPIDVAKARNIAQATGGKYYTTHDPTKLPQIFIKEAQVVRRSLIHEAVFRPHVADGLSPVIAGISAAELPPLGGYVLTTPKELAQVPLVRPAEDAVDPILAHWHVGLGKSVAFTSGMWHRWGTEWAAWPGFSKVWAQIVRWAARQSPAGNFDVTTSVDGGRGRLRISARDKSAAAVNFMSIRGELVGPQQDVKTLQLTQVGPGEYEAEFDARTPGSYVFNLGYSGGGQTGQLQTGVSVAYSPEFRELRANEAFIQSVAQRSGQGRVLALPDAARVFDRAGLSRAEVRHPVWEALVQSMLVLFLLDVAIRRVAINPVELARRLRRRIAEIGGARAPAEASAATLATLRGTRAGVRDTLANPSGEAGPAPDRAARYVPPATPQRASEDLSRALGGATEMDAPVVARPTRKPPPQGEADYTSRLLMAKKKARDEMQDDQNK